MNKRFSRLGTLVIALLLVISPGFLFGQGIVTGSISGTVVDPQGAVVSGAKVTAKDSQTNREFTATTDSNGAYSMRGIPVGVYTVTMEAPNFKRVQVAGVQVFSGRVTAMGSRTLDIGEAGEVVDVEGTAPLVEATSSQVSTSFESRKVSDLPINAGGFDALALLVPGVASAGDAAFSNSNGADLSSNGQRGRSNNFQIDGQSNNDNSVAGPAFFLNNPDVVAEFQIITNNYSAEYGRNMGSVVNYVTKSGTNNFHGTAFWFHENSATTTFANEEKNPLLGFCSPGQDPAVDGCEIPEKFNYRENRLGGSLGGPLVADKLWFFGSFLDSRLRGTGVASTASAFPTPTGISQLAAAFGATNPAVVALQSFGAWAFPTGDPRPTNIETIDVNGVPIEFGGITRNAPVIVTGRQWTGRFDWQASEKDRFFVRYLFDGSNFASPTGVVGQARTAVGAWADVPSRTNQIGVDWSRSWTSRFINQFRWSFSRAEIFFHGGTGMACTVQSILDCPPNINLPPGFADFGMQTNLPQSRLVNNTQFQDNASWVIGRHTIKFGGSYDRQRTPNVFLPSINGSFNYASFDDFINNNPRSFQLALGPEGLTYKEQDLAFYAQDDWRIFDNLTLNLGIRWEWFEQAINDLAAITEARENDPATALWNPNLPLEDRTVPRVPQDRNNFGPNLGFAWTPRIWEGLFGRDKTVIRGGYRIAYDPAFYNIFLNVQTSAPLVNLGTVSGVGLPAGVPLSGNGLRAAGYEALFPTGCASVLCDPRFRNQTVVGDDFRNPYTQQWSLGIQRQISPKIAAEVRYVGNHTIGNFQTIDANPLLLATTVVGPGPDAIFGTADDQKAAVPGFGLIEMFPDVVPAGITPCTDPAAPGFGRIDCNREVVRERRNSAFSIYHGLQTRLDFQNWHGLTAGGAYTFSKAIDNVSEIFATFAGGNTHALAQSPFCTDECERGVSGTSYPHVASAYWIYEVPWMRSQEGFLGHILGGWQINGAWRYRSGQPFNPIQFFGWNTACGLADTFGLGVSTINAAFFSGVSNCRPFVGNEGAPLNTMGICTNDVTCDPVDFFGPAFLGDTPSTACVNPGDCTVDDFHWIYNDFTAASFFGTPFGSGRHIVRAQDSNNLDFGVYKNTKITERFTVQFQWNAFNILNRQFRGTPGTLPEFGQDPNTGGDFMNNLLYPSNNRFMTFGLKLIF